MWLVMCCVMAAAAGTEGPEAIARGGLEWHAVDRGALLAYDVAATASVAGLATTFAGIVLRDQRVEDVGLALGMPVAPAMTAAGLRSSTSLRKRGERVPVAAGALSWGLSGTALALYGASFVARAGLPDDETLGASEPWLLASFGAQLVAVTAAGLQHNANRAPRRHVDAAAVSLVPTLDPPGVRVVRVR